MRSILMVGLPIEVGEEQNIVDKDPNGILSTLEIIESVRMHCALKQE